MKKRGKDYCMRPSIFALAKLPSVVFIDQGENPMAQELLEPERNFDKSTKLTNVVSNSTKTKVALPHSTLVKLINNKEPRLD